MSNRILDYPEATEITSDDYILLDNAGTGAKCIKASALNINMDNYTIKEARGSIASFDDGEDLPLAFMGAYITAIQDLHGYDYPWVGGAGKNKLKNATSLGSRTINGVTITTREDGSLLFNGTSTGAVNFIINSNVQLPDNTYILSTDTTMPTNSIIAVNTSDGNKTTQDSVTFTGSVNGNVWIYVGQEGVVFNNLIIKPMIRLATVADATFAPYSNICPISGWDEANVVVSPTTDAEDGQTYTIQFKDGDNPLTVYGGTLDVVSGVLTVDRGYVDLGTLNYTYYSGNLFTASISNLKPIPNERLCNALCSIYVAKKGIEYAFIDGSFVAGFNNSRTLAIHDSRFTDATAIKTALAGQTVCYPLATPQTYQLTPTMIYSLIGENNIFADTGDSIVDYRKLWIKPEM